jgi:hypothetical protein
VAELLAKIMLNRPEVRERILTHRAHEKAALTAQLTLEVSLHPKVFSRKIRAKDFFFREISVKFFFKFTFPKFFWLI